MKNLTKCAFARTPKSWYKIWFARIRTEYQWNILRTGTSLARRQRVCGCMRRGSVTHDSSMSVMLVAIAMPHESLITSCHAALPSSSRRDVSLKCIYIYIYKIYIYIYNVRRYAILAWAGSDSRTSPGAHNGAASHPNGSTVTTDVHSSYDHWIAHVFLITLCGLSR